MPNVYIFGGGKGGVGKTTAALAFVLSQQQAGRSIHVREGDATNPDVARALGIDGSCILNPLELADWSDVLQAALKSDVIVNLPGGGDSVFLEHASAIAEAAAADGNRVVFISTLNRSRECVLLLKNNLELLAGSNVTPVAVLNEFFGEAAKFTRFNKSKTREQLSAAGGIEVVLPELPEFVADALISPGGQDLKTAPSLTRAIYSTWLAKVSTNFTAMPA